mmetsp:Transcript_48794/g.116145  ORF Transcript_48794/g.116145 Transcript_48794/m.116145 type:complete len:331 (+) Transcript_48794:173-1165(+)
MEVEHVQLLPQLPECGADEGHGVEGAVGLHREVEPVGAAVGPALWCHGDHVAVLQPEQVLGALLTLGREGDPNVDVLELQHLHLTGDVVELEETRGARLDPHLPLLYRQPLEFLVVELDDRLVGEHHPTRRRPLRVHLAEALFRDGSEFEGLVALELRDHHGIVRVVLHRHHAAVLLEFPAVLAREDQVLRGHLEGVLVGVAHVQLELDLALRLLVGLVVPEEGARVPALVAIRRRPVRVEGAVGDEGEEPETVRDELVSKHRGVVLDLHQIDRDGRHLGHDCLAEAVRDGHISVGQDERDLVLFDRPQFDLRDRQGVVRHFAEASPSAR